MVCVSFSIHPHIHTVFNIQLLILAREKKMPAVWERDEGRKRTLFELSSKANKLLWHGDSIYRREICQQTG